MAQSGPTLEIDDGADAVIARFAVKKVINDQHMEAAARELNSLADTLNGRELRLDFVNVEYMQSSVLGKLVSLHKKVANAGSRLILCNICPGALKVFTATKLDSLFTIEGAK